MGTRTIGFSNDDPAAANEKTRRGSSSGRRDVGMLEQVQPLDLIKSGFIPEFIGRLPVVAVLDELSKEALVQILTKPKGTVNQPTVSEAVRI